MERGHLSGGDSSEDRCASQLCSADVVSVEQTAGCVSDSIESRNHSSFVIDHLSVCVNLRTAECCCNTALERESVVRSLI